MAQAHPYQYFLEHQGRLIELPRGEVWLGRALECGIRFNDASLSRKHLRLIIEAVQVFAQDMGSTNGTLLNAQPLEGTRRVSHGDVLQVGERTLRITRLQEQQSETVTPPFSLPALSPMRPRAEPLAESAAPVGDMRVVMRTCPSCRTAVSVESDMCTDCGYEWPTGRLWSRTLQLEPAELQERRLETRVAVTIPLLYTSDSLAFEAEAIDLSRGGVYVHSELLEPVGTTCRVSLLPDGHPAIKSEGIVRHVVPAESNDRARQPGMGIEFTSISEAGQRWVESFLPCSETDLPAVS